jgi:hypothetical protein
MNEHDEPITLEKLFRLIQLQADIITQLQKNLDLVFTALPTKKENRYYKDYYDSRELEDNIDKLTQNVKSIDDDIYWTNIESMTDNWTNYHKEN